MIPAAVLMAQVWIHNSVIPNDSSHFRGIVEDYIQIKVLCRHLSDASLRNRMKTRFVVLR